MGEGTGLKLSSLRIVTLLLFLSQAPVTVQSSVRGILNVLANLSSASNGAFLDWEGNTLPW